MKTAAYRMGNRAGALLAVVLMVILSSFAQAQTIPGAPAAGGGTEPATASDPSPNDVRELMRLLSDPAISQWLQRQAETVGEPDDATDNSAVLQREFAARLDAMSQRITALSTSIAAFPLLPRQLATVWRSGMSADQSLRTMIYVIVFLVIGAGLEWLYRQYTQTMLLRLEIGSTGSMRNRLRPAALRALLILAGLLVFCAGSIGAFVSFDWPEFVRDLVIDLLLIVIAVRLVATLSIFFIAPRVPELRLVPMPNRLATALHRWLITLTTLFAVFRTLGNLLDGLARSGEAASAILSVNVVTAAILSLSTIAAVWHIRTIVAQKSNIAAQLRFGSRFWRGYLTGLIILAFGFWIIDLQELKWTVLIVGLLFPVMSLVNRCITIAFDAFFDQESSDPSSEDRDDINEQVVIPASHLYIPVLRRLIRFVLVISAIFALVAAWGGNLLSLSESPTVTGRVVRVVADVVAAILIADLIWVWAKSSIDRRLANYVPPQGSEAPGPEARMATLLPIVRVTILVVLIAVGGMMVLSSLGVNVAPLLAGAGVVGIAVGFGAQALVRDIMSGIFFLIDDAFRVGEYIEIGELRGTVESMSIRSLRVRHHLGAIHTIPFGELSSLTNYSRDWVIMRLEFRVPFDTDLMLIKKIVKKIGAEMLEHDTYGKDIIQTLKSQGVRRMEEFNMVIGVKFMCKPGAQWLMRRDAYHQLRDAFEKSGIHFAQRNVKVEVQGDRPMDEATRKAITGAVQDSLEPVSDGQTAIPDEP